MVIIHAVVRMGPPPRSLAAEAIGCFMVRSPAGDQPNTRLRRDPSRPMAGSPRFVDSSARSRQGWSCRHLAHPASPQRQRGTLANQSFPDVTREEPRPAWGAAGTLGPQTPVAAFTPNVEEPKNGLDTKRPHTSSYSQTTGFSIAC